VLASIRILLKEPNLDDPLMTEIAQEYAQDYEKYFKTAQNFK
jgi:ubiquitin-protein ligase